MPRPRKYPQELIERGVRLAIESGRPVSHVARDIGLPAEVLRKRVRQAEADQGLQPGLPTSEEREEIKRLKRENYELRRANEILKAASVFLRPSSTQTCRGERVIDQYRERFGVEPICETLDVSASAYYERASGQRSPRRVEDQRLVGRVREVHEANYECHPTSRAIRTTAMKFPQPAISMVVGS